MSNKILVVDDDLNICELLKLYLENEGYTAFVANDGQAAVDTFAAKNPRIGLRFDMFTSCAALQHQGRVFFVQLFAVKHGKFLSGP